MTRFSTELHEQLEGVRRLGRPRSVLRHGLDKQHFDKRHGGAGVGPSAATARGGGQKPPTIPLSNRPPWSGSMSLRPAASNRSRPATPTELARLGVRGGGHSLGRPSSSSSGRPGTTIKGMLMRGGRGGRSLPQIETGISSSRSADVATTPARPGTAPEARRFSAPAITPISCKRPSAAHAGGGGGGGRRESVTTRSTAASLRQASSFTGTPRQIWSSTDGHIFVTRHLEVDETRGGGVGGSGGGLVRPVVGVLTGPGSRRNTMKHGRRAGALGLADDYKDWRAMGGPGGALHESFVTEAEILRADLVGRSRRVSEMRFGGRRASLGVADDYSDQVALRNPKGWRAVVTDEDIHRLNLGLVPKGSNVGVGRISSGSSSSSGGGSGGSGGSSGSGGGGRGVGVSSPLVATATQPVSREPSPLASPHSSSSSFSSSSSSPAAVKLSSSSSSSKSVRQQVPVPHLVKMGQVLRQRAEARRQRKE